jgi:hypothetical protein
MTVMETLVSIRTSTVQKAVESQSPIDGGAAAASSISPITSEAAGYYGIPSPKIITYASTTGPLPVIAFTETETYSMSSTITITQSPTTSTASSTTSTDSPPTTMPVVTYPPSTTLTTLRESSSSSTSKRISNSTTSLIPGSTALNASSSIIPQSGGVPPEAVISLSLAAGIFGTIAFVICILYRRQKRSYAAAMLVGPRLPSAAFGSSAMAENAVTQQCKSSITGSQGMKTQSTIIAGSSLYMPYSPQSGPNDMMHSLFSEVPGKRRLVSSPLTANESMPISPDTAYDATFALEGAPSAYFPGDQAYHHREDPHEDLYAYTTAGTFSHDHAPSNEEQEPGLGLRLESKPEPEPEPEPKPELEPEIVHVATRHRSTIWEGTVRRFNALHLHLSPSPLNIVRRSSSEPGLALRGEHLQSPDARLQVRRNIGDIAESVKSAQPSVDSGEKQAAHAIALDTLEGKVKRKERGSLWRRAYSPSIYSRYDDHETYARRDHGEPDPRHDHRSELDSWNDYRGEPDPQRENHSNRYLQPDYRGEPDMRRDYRGDAEPQRDYRSDGDLQLTYHGESGSQRDLGEPEPRRDYHGDHMWGSTSLSPSQWMKP